MRLEFLDVSAVVGEKRAEPLRSRRVVIWRQFSYGWKFLIGAGGGVLPAAPLSQLLGPCILECIALASEPWLRRPHRRELSEERSSIDLP